MQNINETALRILERIFNPEANKSGKTLVCCIGRQLVHLERGRIVWAGDCNQVDLQTAVPNFFPGLFLVYRKNWPIRDGFGADGVGIQLVESDTPEFSSAFEKFAGSQLLQGVIDDRPLRQQLGYYRMGIVTAVSH